MCSGEVMSPHFIRTQNEHKENSMKLIQNLGMEYPTNKSIKKIRYGLFECPECNKIFKKPFRTTAKSCGCIRNKSVTKHGLSSHELYSVWNGMRRRVFNKKCKDFKHYGGRGITICNRWLNVENFIEDMYPSYKKGLEIDRTDNDKNYGPDNCRWAERTTQNRNNRQIRANNTSGYRGIYFIKRNKRWKAQISVNSLLIYLGCYKTDIEAAEAYDKYVIDNNLEHTRNFS